MEIAARWSALPARVRRGVLAALRGVDGMVLASAHLSHAYLDGACLYFTFGGHPPTDQRESFYRRAWDAGMEATLAGGAALSHHHGVGLNRARFARAALGEAFDGAGRDQGRARSPRHPEPGQARPAEPVGRTRLAVKRLVLALLVVVVLGALALPAGSVPERHGRRQARAVDRHDDHDHDHHDHLAPAAGVRRHAAWTDCGGGFQCGTLTVPIDWTAPGPNGTGDATHGAAGAAPPPGRIAGRAHRVARRELRRSR